jgi:hypothetical protein
MYMADLMDASGWVSLDTLYLSVRYPRGDVYRAWERHVRDATYRTLRLGVRVGDHVVRGGSAGYRISVWQYDARAFLTDQVDERVGEGRGMGIWVQLGPRFLMSNSGDLQGAVSSFLEGIGVHGDQEVRVTRIDLALDLPGMEMSGQDLELWRQGWVGRSKVSSVFMNPRTGELQTIYVGARGSSVLLRVYDKVAQAYKEGDLEYWRDAWDAFDGPVCRVEWEVRPGDGGFRELRDFNVLSDTRLMELGRYLLGWGRLCVPRGDTNNRRWPVSPFWRRVSRAIEQWAANAKWATTRMGKELNGISEGYVRFLSGAVTGGMARFGKESAGWYELAKGLEERGQGQDVLMRKAKEKAKVFSRL